MSVLDTLRAATPARKSVEMCVNGALQAEWDATLDELDKADETGTGSLAQPAVTEIADRLDALREQMAASKVTFHFEKMPWAARLALQAEHPPREGNMVDRIRGFNAETYYPAYIRGSVCSVVGVDGEEVTEIPDDVWDSLLGVNGSAGSLNTGQVNTLIGLADAVNNGQTSVPPSARSLLESQVSGASLAQPSPGADLPPSGSEDGSPSGSPSTSTSPTTSTSGDESALAGSSSEA